MTQVISFVRIAASAGLVAVLASACGGQSFDHDGEPQGGTSAKAGSTSRGGSGSQAGAGATTGGSLHRAGSGAGGSSGSGSAGAGTAGAGGNATEACVAPPVVGPCDALVQAWYHDPSTGVCRPFNYGGCEGNKNRYDSLAACQKACPGGSPNYDSCTQPGDCTLTGVGCCGVCDAPDLSVHDFVAINKKYAATLLCVTPLALPAPGTPGIGAPIACAPCPAPPAGAGTLKYFVPDCVQGQCAVTDLRTSATCTTDDECRLRNGTGCCESCSDPWPIAVRKDGSFEKRVCGDEPVPCPACVPDYASGATAICGQSGRCEVVYRQ